MNFIVSSCFIFCINLQYSFCESIDALCQTIKTLDTRLCKSLEEMPKYEGEYVVKDMADYNAAISRLSERLIDDRESTLNSQCIMGLLKEGAPEYFAVSIDPDLAIMNFGWRDKGIDEIYVLRAEAVNTWSKINRMARVVPLDHYFYPENGTYTYESPDMPLFQPGKCEKTSIEITP